LNFEEVRQRVRVALSRLRVQDSFLIQANTNERTISHKLAEHLQEEFSMLKVDCEYNRHGDEIKRLAVPNDNINWDDTEAKTVFPDIIVHQRNNDNNNLLVIEVKKSSNAQNSQLDKNKLVAFTKEPYRYSFGLFLRISMHDTDDSLDWYENGRAKNE
jgi:hypothetical protein